MKTPAILTFLLLALAGPRLAGSRAGDAWQATPTNNRITASHHHVRDVTVNLYTEEYIWSFYELQTAAGLGYETVAAARGLTYYERPPAWTDWWEVQFIPLDMDLEIDHVGEPVVTIVMIDTTGDGAPNGYLLHNAQNRLPLFWDRP